jgi:hypothetical protein
MRQAKTSPTPARPGLTACLAAFVGLAASAAAGPAAAVDGCWTAPPPLVYGLSNDNVLFVRNPTAGQFVRLARVTGVDGTLIGIDFRPADASRNVLTGVSDTGQLHVLKIDGNRVVASPIGWVTPRFAGGFQSVVDFNPVVDALRLVGSNDQNVAVVNAGGNLNRTVPQSPLRYVTGDASAGIDPNITGGAYDNNVAGAPLTTFFMVDFDLNTLVTIAQRNAAGSSDTGSGLLRTVGPITDAATGNPLEIAPTADLDIVTPAPGTNLAYLVNGQALFCIDVSAFGPGATFDAPQKVPATLVEATGVVNPGRLPTDTGIGFIDVAAPPTP